MQKNANLEPTPNGANLAPATDLRSDASGPSEPLSVGPLAQNNFQEGPDLTRWGGTPAHCLRSARAAQAAIAKVFTKICEKNEVCKFWTCRTLVEVENYVLSKFQP